MVSDTTKNKPDQDDDKDLYDDGLRYNPDPWAGASEEDKAWRDEMLKRKKSDRS